MEGRILFISYSTLDEFQVQKLAEDLRKEQIQVFTYPFDVPDASNVIEGIRVQTSKDLMLAVALSPNSIHQPWIKKGIPNDLLPAFADRLDTCVLKLVDISARDLARLGYATAENLVELNGEAYGAGVKALIQRVAGGPLRSSTERTAPTSSVDRAATYSMTAIFDRNRPATGLLTELKSQIERGSINQKYLYWDVRAAIRWQRIAELSGYMTVQMAMNLLAKDAGAIIATTVAGDDRPVTFINLGVGTGVKDYLLLSQLLEVVDRVSYFAVDESFPMIQLTMETLDDLMSAARPGTLSLNYIVDDVENLHRYRQIISTDEGEGGRSHRVFCFDNMLGNFREGKVLRLIQGLMGKGDHLLLGVEYVADRSDEDLMRNYRDRRMKEFLFGPIADATGSREPDWARAFRYQVLANGRRVQYSEVEGTKVVAGSVLFDGKDIELFYSSKYEPNALRDYLITTMKFEVVASYETQEAPPRYGVTVLRLT